jgi:fused signal recognition particle receptor
MSLFKKMFTREKKETLDKGLEKSKTNFLSKMGKAVAGKAKVDDEVLDDLEDVLISSDVGVATTIKIIKRIEERVARDKYLGTDELTRSSGKKLPGYYLKPIPEQVMVLPFLKIKSHMLLWW